MSDVLDRPHHGPPAPPRPELLAHLDSWVSEGLLTATQAARIDAREHGRTLPPARGARLLTEGLAYVGSALVAVAALVLIGRVWNDLPAWAHVGLPLLAAVALLAAGSLVPASSGPVASRIRSVTWAASVLALAAAAAVLVQDVLEWRTDEDVVLLTAGVSTAYAAVLWTRHVAPLQVTATIVPLLVVAGTGGAQLEADAAPGLAVWLVALGCLGLTAARWLPPARVSAVLGTVGLLVGAQATAPAHGWGHLLALLTTAGVVAAGVVLADVVVLGVGAVWTLAVVPAAVGYWFPGRFSVPIALLLAGGLLLVAAVRSAHAPRRTVRRAPRSSDPTDDVARDVRI